jgi:cyclase
MAHPYRQRRQFLRATLGMAAAAAVSPRWPRELSAQASSDALSAQPVRDGLEIVGGAGSNAVLLRTTAGAALVDSGSPQSASALKSILDAKLGATPLSLMFNTHWHPAHSGGNETVRGADTTIVAHELTRLWMATEYYVDWEDRTYSPRVAAALPTRTFYASDPQPIAARVGDETIEYGHLPEAHTDGDIYVLFKERNVLAAGGVVTAGSYPVIDHATGGWIGGLVDATKKLIAITDASTLIVPADGPARPRSHLEAQLEMLTVVHERIANLMRKGRSIAEMLEADVTAGFDADWGSNRERFVANIYHGLWWAGRLDGSL